MHPSIFDPFASVTLMAANLDNSIMYKYFAKVGCEFSEHLAVARLAWDWIGDFPFEITLGTIS